MTFMSGTSIKSKISIFEKISSLNFKQNVIKETEILPRIFKINFTSFEKTTEYLKDKQKYLFLNFEDQNDVFNHEIRFSDRMILTECISFVQIMHFWLNLDEKAIIIIRNQKKELLETFLVCFLRFSKDQTFENAFKIIKKQIPQAVMPKDVILNLFEQYIQNQEFKTLQLHQIVISTLPKRKNDDKKPFLRPFYALRLVEKPTVSEVIHDNHHIIFKIDATVASDITLEIMQNNMKLFSLYINSIGYDEGLYRFNSEDCSIEKDTILDKNFSVDIVFFATDRKNKIQNFDGKSQIVDRLVGNYNSKIFNQLKTKGFKHDDAIIGALLQETSFKPISTTIIQEKVKFLENEKENTLSQRPYEPNDNFELSEIELIKDFIPEKDEKKIKKKKLAPKRKIQNITEEMQKSTVVVRPFYWAVIPKSYDSIFNDLSDLPTYIDCTKFEEWFSISTEEKEYHIDKQKSTIIKDSRRLFLVSISLKTFEKRELMLNVNSLNKMSFEDLIVIERIIPTEEEYYQLKMYRSKCNEIEMKMLDFFPYRKLIKILMFERRFFENKDKWMLSIEKIKNGYDNILQSNNIRLLLKIVLEVGNLINTQYGNNKKTASAFRVSSLSLTKAYRGKYRNQSLLKFVADSARSRLKSIKREIDELVYLKKEDVSIYKDCVNEHIMEYKEYKNWLPQLDDVSRANMKSFFNYFSDYILKFNVEYKETVIFASIIKRKFGEAENMNVKDIISYLHEFFDLIREEIEN